MYYILKPGEIIQIEKIYCDNNNNIYLIDSKKKQIFKYDKEGNYLHQFGERNNCYDYVAVNPKNNDVYAVNCSRHIVDVYSKTGEYLRAFVDANFYGDQYELQLKSLVFDENEQIYVLTSKKNFNL